MSAILTVGLALQMAFGLAAADDTPEMPEAQNVIVQAVPTAVTLYRGRASVTRSHTADLNPGVYALRFAGLPESIVPQTIQAHAEGPVKVLGVEFESQPADASSSPEIARIDQQIERLQAQLREFAGQGELINSEEEFINAVSIRATTDASDNGGTDRLDLDAVKKQLTFVSQERARLMESRRELESKQQVVEKELQGLQARRSAMGAPGGAGGVSRVAVVSMVVTESSPVHVELTYLVTNATWEPTYNIRAALDGSSAQIEYDAALTQRTGEDWEGVALTLSTAQPTLAANPPALQPWFVDLYTPESERTDAPAEAAPPAPAKYAYAQRDLEMDALKALAADAQIGGAGPSVTYQLPRRVTISSNSQMQQHTRIATIDTNPNLVHVAQPLLTESVYLRGDLTNPTGYQLLPGRASIFVGQDYVGPTTIDSVAPGGQFKVFFGIDEAVKAARQMINKKTENTGLLGGGRRTSYDYRIAIDNGTGKPITLELRDRLPVSRSDQIQIELTDVSEPLASDAYFTTEERPLGILKWWLSVPASARALTPYEVTYGVRVNRSKDVEMTPLPE